MVLFNTFLIACIWTFILDISGFMDVVKRAISKKLTKGAITTADFSIKPFDCSLCMTFWTGLIYLICINSISIPLIGWVCLMSLSTNWILSIYYTIDNLINKIINKIS